MHARHWFLAILTLASLLRPAPVAGATVRAGFTETTIASGLSHPTTMAFAPDGRLFVAEQAGSLRVIKNGALLPIPFLTLDVGPHGERGLLGIAFDPQFTSNHFVYVYYTATTPTDHNRVSRFTADGDVAQEGSEVVVLDLPELAATVHNGGAMHFGPDGYLYIAVGENGVAWNAQDLSTPLGKMLRIRSDGTIPQDNPFVAQTTGINGAIWAVGLRNPFKFTFDSFSGRMLINDVGEDDWEEINDGLAGANYGWPETQGVSDEFGLTNPLYAYAHVDGACAITGGAVYSTLPSAFPSEYAGDYFFADFCGGWIRHLDFADGIDSNDFVSGIAAPVDVVAGPEGSLYYLSRGWGDDTGTVVRIDYTGEEPPISSNPPPTGDDDLDIGSVRAAGWSEETGGALVVRGSGADVWGTSDAFHGRMTEVTGDFDAVVHLTSIEHVDDWTKAGLMIRDGLSASARHTFLFATPTGSNGVAFQRRTIAGGPTSHTAGPSVSSPVWLRLSRRGDVVQAWSRMSATDPWQLIGGDAIEGLPATALVGLVVTSHRDGVLAAAVFEAFSIAPAGDLSADVGAVAVLGDSAIDGSSILVRGSGADIWGTSDAFHWRYTEATGDFDAVVHVTAVDPVRAWTKAGLMIRASTAPGAVHMSLFATPEHGIAFQRRRQPGGESFNTPGPEAAAPVWLRLSRRGSFVYTFYRLTPTDLWTFLDVDVASSLPDSALVGLAVTSHIDGVLAEGDFEDFTVTPVSALVARDVGVVAVPGQTRTDPTVTSITASGADIWNTADAFHFDSSSWHGDGSITARVLWLENTDPWAKAGLMFRSSLDPGSAHAMVVVSAANGISMQYRSEANAASAQAANIAGAAPGWLRLMRTGYAVSAFASSDGMSWTLISTVQVALGADVYVGLAVTSHDNSRSTRADFDQISISSD